MKTPIILLAAAAILSLSTTFAQAQDGDTQYRGEFRDWHLYVHEAGDDRTCYIASEPTEEEGNFSRRSQPALLVAQFPIEAPNVQVSVQPGYPYKGEDSAEVTIDGEAFDFFTRDEGAWTVSSEIDEEVIDAMKRGRELTVRGTSQKDTFSLDTYSLLGFTAAFEAMSNACAG